MEHYSEAYFCENCGHPEFSSVGNPLYGFEDKLINMNVCKDCLKELEDKKQEREKNEH